MTEEEPEQQHHVIEAFADRLLDNDLSRSILDEFCAQYPDLREELERKFDVMTAIDGAFGEDGLAGSVIGDFLVCEEIGRGGMGVVYLALQQSLDRYVALKVLPSPLATGGESVRRMQAEARTIARFNHPNIVPIFSSGVEKGVYYIAMALIPGLPMSRVIEALKTLSAGLVTPDAVRDILLGHPDLPRAGSLDRETGYHPSIMVCRGPSFWDRPYPDFVFSLCSEIADALGYAHRCGVCHGDLKPSNIMLTAGGTPMVVDFGLARDVRTLASVQSKDFLGTLAYSSPEHLSGNVRSAASDIWSLGVTMYEMLTLRQPFTTDDVSSTLHRIARMEPPPIRSTGVAASVDMEAVVAKCMEKEPRRRYRDAGSLKEDVDNVLASRPVAARPVGRLGRYLKWVKRNRAMSLLILFLLLSSATASYALFGFTVRSIIVEGTRYTDEGRYTEAVRSYERALWLLEWTPFSARRRAEVTSAIGSGWWGKGDYEKAIRFFEAALRLDPDCVPALMGLADVYFERGAYDRTVTLYNRVLFLSPQDRYSYYQRAKAFREKGMYDDALKDFHWALKLAPGDRETMGEIYSLLEKKGLVTESGRRGYLREKGFSDREIGLVLGVEDQKR